MRVSSDVRVIKKEVDKKKLEDIEVCTDVDYLLGDDMVERSVEDSDLLSKDVLGVMREIDFIYAKENNRKLNKENLRLQKELENLEIEKDNLDIKKSEVPRSRKKKRSIRKGMLAVGTVMVLATGIVVYTARTREVDLDMVGSKTGRLYTSDSKEDLKDNVSEDDISVCLEKLSEVQTSDFTAKDTLEQELNTMSRYLIDKSILEEIDADSYDLNTSDMQEKLNNISQSVSSYTVSGLAVTASDKVKCIEDEYAYYESLKAELTLVEDYLNFDYEGYISKANKISHTVNREELVQMITNLNFEKLKAEGIQNAKEVAEEEAVKMAEKFQKVTDEKIGGLEEKIEGIKDFCSDAWDTISGWN